jgi:uncharacterized protein YjbI with pentapeptide repeats
VSDIKNIQDLKDQYQQGIRYFRDLSFEKGEDLISTDFSDFFFEHCSLSINFSNANLQNVKFLSCNLQGTDFSNAILTNSQIENCYSPAGVCTGRNLSKSAALINTGSLFFIYHSFLFLSLTSY